MKAGLDALYTRNDPNAVAAQLRRVLDGAAPQPRGGAIREARPLAASARKAQGEQEGPLDRCELLRGQRADELGQRASGRLAGTRGVYVADAATLPALPSKNHSFTLMANAMRIAEHVGRTLR
jgi:hypothetical protein